MGRINWTAAAVAAAAGYGMNYYLQKRMPGVYQPATYLGIGAAALVGYWITVKYLNGDYSGGSLSYLPSSGALAGAASPAASSTAGAMKFHSERFANSYL